jgi:hypothetical protein
VTESHLEASKEEISKLGKAPSAVSDISIPTSFHLYTISFAVYASKIFNFSNF